MTSNVSLTDTLDLFRRATHLTIVELRSEAGRLRHDWLGVQRQITAVEAGVVILPGGGRSNGSGIDLRGVRRVQIDRFGNLTLNLPGGLRMTVQLERIAAPVVAIAA